MDTARRPLLQSGPAPSRSFVERFRNAGRRSVALGLALLVELLILLLLLTLGREELPGGKKGSGRLTVVDLAPDAAPEAPEPATPEKQRAETRPEPQPKQPQQPLPPPPVAPKDSPILRTLPNLPPLPAPSPPRSQPSPPSSARSSYGPVDSGGSSASRDSERVGTAPNGQPLYAAAWYREPTHEMLRGYLSTATGPAWGLIACRTVPDFRVEDCVGIDEYPHGSQMMRAVLAAAWEFRVRPPQLGGNPLVGAWVRIRIDYEIKRN